MLEKFKNFDNQDKLHLIILASCGFGLWCIIKLIRSGKR
jgi:hypothetical protein